MLDNLNYANTRLSSLGIINDEQARRRLAYLKSVQETKNQAIDNEICQFFKGKIGSDSYHAIRLAKDRGEFLTYAAIDKVEFKFDGVIVFSVEVKAEAGQLSCEVTRHY